MAEHLPNFLIIGAAKSATTALFEYLEQHPQVYLSNPKEPHFLALGDARPAFAGPADDVTINRLAVTGFARYQKLFAGAGSAKAIGEASVSTMYYPESIGRIQQHLPDARLVCILRQPADRAYSAFSFMHTRAVEPCESFADALNDEDRRVARNWHHIWHYRRMGFYYEQLKPYFEAFGRERIRAYLFEDFRDDPQAVLRDCMEFLEIDSGFVPTHAPAPHVSGRPRSRWIQTLYNRARRTRAVLRRVVPSSMKRELQRRFAKMNLERVPLSPELRGRLTAVYRDDISRLQDLLDRDLSLWLPDEARRPGPGR